MENVENLHKAREQLVAARRVFAKKLAGTYERGRTEERMAKFVSMQDAIESIDRAIVDEATSPRGAVTEETLYEQFARR